MREQVGGEPSLLILSVRSTANAKAPQTLQVHVRPKMIQELRLQSQNDRYAPHYQRSTTPPALLPKKLSRVMPALHFLVRPTTLQCFVYFQVNNGIWSFLDYVEDIAADRPLRLPSNILPKPFAFIVTYTLFLLFCLRCFSGVPAWRLM